MERGSDMVDTHDDFKELIGRISDGSEDAAWELVENYSKILRLAVRRVLDSRLRSKFDSMDFVQLVWMSFFHARDKLYRLNTPEELAAFLAVMARNKVGLEYRRRVMTYKYNLNKEHTLDIEVQAQGDIVENRQPPAIDVAIAREQWNKMLQDQPQHFHKIIQLRLQGHTYKSIARSLNLAECTIRRSLAKLLLKRVA
jgi:RNA polymerase sigma factor (sigma-70 family)